MEHTIRLVEAPLSDGSLVYDVWIGDEHFPCVSLNDAEQFVDSFCRLVEKHTNEETKVQS